MGITGVEGAFVYGVYEDSPAGRAGLQPGDVITRVGEATISDSGDLVRTVASLEPGKEITLEVVRDGRRVSAKIQTAKRDEASGSDVSNLWPGVSIVPLTDEVREQLSVENRTNGVVVAAVAAESAAANSGIRQGDVITAVNGTRINSARDFYREIESTGDELQFRVVRGDTQVILGFVKPAV
jgi:serine protease Do